MVANVDWFSVTTVLAESLTLISNIFLNLCQIVAMTIPVCRCSDILREDKNCVQVWIADKDCRCSSKELMLIPVFYCSDKSFIKFCMKFLFPSKSWIITFNRHHYSHCLLLQLLVWSFSYVIPASSVHLMCLGQLWRWKVRTPPACLYLYKDLHGMMS